MDAMMMEKHQRMQELMTEMQSIMSEMMGASELPPEEKKQKEKEKDAYLKKTPEERDALDKKKLLEEPAGDDTNAI